MSYCLVTIHNSTSSTSAGCRYSRVLFLQYCIHGILFKFVIIHQNSSVSRSFTIAVHDHGNVYMYTEQRYINLELTVQDIKCTFRGDCSVQYSTIQIAVYSVQCTSVLPSTFCSTQLTLYRIITRSFKDEFSSCSVTSCSFTASPAAMTAAMTEAKYL